MKQYIVDENPYEGIYVDLTSKCNMKCTYCYNPDRTPYEMSLDYFKEMCERLPNPVYMRFLGGEPALHPDFFSFIVTAKKAGHHVYFSSNGLIFNDKVFVEELADLQKQFPFAPGITLDGGLSGRSTYEQMNGGDYLGKKIDGLLNLVEAGVKRITLSAIITRDVNEFVIPELIGVAKDFEKNIRYIHYRTAAMVGRWADTESYTLPELKELVRPHFAPLDFLPRCINEIHCPPKEMKTCCYRFHPTRRLQVSLIEFATKKSAKCSKRGKLLPEGFLIEPFFENMMENG